MAPLTAWMPVRAGHQDLDLVVKVVGHAASECLEDWVPVVRLLASRGFSVMAQAGIDSEDGFWLCGSLTSLFIRRGPAVMC